MRKRWFTLVNAQTLSDAQTFNQSLIGVGKIYALRAKYQATNGATSNTVGNIHSMVSKLQVLDGSRVLTSASMSELQALNAYRRGQLPSMSLTLDAAGVIDEDVFVDYWLDLSDDTHYLDTNNYTSPVLAFTHALTISATAGFATGTGKLTVEALLGDAQAPPSAGFLMVKELDTFTAATSGIRADLLSLDLPYVAVMVLSGVNTADPTATITNIKMSVDNDTLILFNRTTADIARMLRGTVPPFYQAIIPIAGGTADVVKSDLYDLVSAYVGPAGATAKSLVTLLSVNQVTTAKTTGETGQQRIGLMGYLPMGAFYLPFGDGYTPADFLDPTGFKKLEVDLTQGAAQSVQVVTLQMAPR